MSLEIRNAVDEELPAYIETISTGFLERPDIDRIVEGVRVHWDLARTWAAFDEGRMCGTFRSWATELTVPGCASVPAAAVAGVGVLPTHRRRGALTALARAEHLAARERGEVAALLYASEYPIYGRFGYGPGCRTARWTLDAHRTGFHGSPVSGVEFAAPDEATRDAAKGVFEAWRDRQPGEIRRRDFRWDEDMGLVASPWGPAWKGFVALHRDAAGAVDGYVRYTADDKWEQRQPRVTIRVNELHALTDEAANALWRFLAEIDLVATVVADGRSPSDPLPWRLTNARAAVPSEIGEGLWVRLLDVPRALEARSWEQSGRLVLDVVDASLPEAATRIALDASPDGAAARPTTESADLTLPVAALSAAYLGGTRLRDAVRATGVDEHRPGALTEADLLLHTVDEPWCSTFF